MLVKQSKFYSVCLEEKARRWLVDVYHHPLFNIDDNLGGLSTLRVRCFTSGKEIGGWMGLGAVMDE